VPVALITVAEGVCHPTLVALIIGRQGRRSIYPDRTQLSRNTEHNSPFRDNPGHSGQVVTLGCNLFLLYCALTISYLSVSVQPTMIHSIY